MSDPFERALFRRARRLCLAFPETCEASSWGHPNFRVGRKTFCTFEILNGRPSIAFRLDRPDCAAAVRRRDFFTTPYGRGLWVSVWVDGVIDWTLIRSLVERSYRLMATKRLVTALNAANPDSPPRRQQ